jgi:integrase
MDLYAILSQRPHNVHYLNRYIKFINACKQTNQNLKEYTEKHHICPKSKSLFPEYKSFKTHPWNLAILTYRQHVIAHILLYKIYRTECQALSVLLTAKQNHVNNKILLKSKLVESIKKTVSEKRKGIFTRGYDSNGNPLVSSETRQKISALQKKRYSDPEERKKHSFACKGTTGRKSVKYSLSAKNRTIEHLQKISESVKKHYSSMTPLQRKRIRTGIYITPFGNFTFISNAIATYCKKSDVQFTPHHIKKNPLLNPSCLGKTPKQLGFDFIPKSDPTISQYYADLNQVHQPEPNHPLWSELNDYLLREKLLP